MSAAIARLRTAAWLGWQIESNWADPFIFVVYAVLRPLATALILAGMYWAAGGSCAVARHVRRVLPGQRVPRLRHLRVLIGMGWVIVEEREEYETLKYVFASPMGIFT